MRFKPQYSIIVLLLLIATGCKQQNNHAGELNDAAGLPQSLKFDQLGFRVITSMINKKNSTMSTLYGNPGALDYAKTKIDNNARDMVFAMVTWKQNDDERWFGAKIPGQLQSIEMVTSKTNGPEIQMSYRIYNEKQGKWRADPLSEKARIKYILAQTASVMP